MQQSLSAYINEQEQLEATLQQQGEHLQKAYKEAQKADRMKMAFLHNMTNQLLEPADSMKEDVLALCSQQQKDARETVRLTESIKKKGEAVAELLKNFINLSDEEIRKEADHA
jgi:methyl-accepting chemotaxis protein